MMMMVERKEKEVKEKEEGLEHAVDMCRRAYSGHRSEPDYTRGRGTLNATLRRPHLILKENRGHWKF